MSKRLSTNLKNRARSWAGQLTSLAKAFAPNHIKPYISSKVDDKGDGTFIIRTTADRFANPKPNYGSMDARAQEFGSGEKARRGVKREYSIRPKKTFGSLAFYENANGTWDYDMFDPPMPREHIQDGRGLFYGVMHPGIQAANAGKGYIHPAMNELRKRARTDLTKDVRDAIVGDLRESFGRKSR